MSAKGDKIRGQFVQQTGAVDAITKPFDARALVAVIEGALSKTAEGRARPVPEGNKMLRQRTRSPTAFVRAGPRSRAGMRAAVELAQQIGSLVAPAGDLKAAARGASGNQRGGDPRRGSRGR